MDMASIRHYLKELNSGDLARIRSDDVMVISSKTGNRTAIS